MQGAHRDAAVRVEGGSSITDIWPVAAQAPQEPYVPGSGEKLPAELRLVLGGYLGIACGLFAGGLACVAAAVVPLVFVIFDAHILSAIIRFDVTELFDDNIVEALCFAIPVGGLGFLGVAMALTELHVRGRFSRLLRQPSDPDTAMVTASKRGGRTLMLDITPGGYQPLSEVPLALWLKAEMLMPGQTVTVYGRPDLKELLLVSSARRAFLGTVASRSAVAPGPLDEKVSGATLIDWAAWAASTTFSSTARLLQGYHIPEVDVFRRAISDTFLGGAVFSVSTPPVRSDEVRGKQFSTHRPGYVKTQVDAFLEAASLRLAAMESTDRPTGPPVDSAVLAGWAEWADSTTFETAGSYDAAEVDALREEIRNTFLGVSQSPVKADDLRGKQFPSDDDQPRYGKKQVDAFLDAASIRLAAMEATDGPERTTR